MRVTTSALVAAPRDQVFAALNDGRVLRHCIPGCEELIEVDADTFSVTLKLGVGGIKGTYTGTAMRKDAQPPESFSFALDGKGKVGFVRGIAAVRIAEDGDQSRVDCDADVQVGGAIAAVGSRLIAAAARKISGDFFREFAAVIGARSWSLDGELAAGAAAERPDPVE